MTHTKGSIEPVLGFAEGDSIDALAAEIDDTIFSRAFPHITRDSCVAAIADVLRTHQPTAEQQREADVSLARYIVGGMIKAEIFLPEELDEMAQIVANWIGDHRREQGDE